VGDRANEAPLADRNEFLGVEVKERVHRAVTFKALRRANVQDTPTRNLSHCRGCMGCLRQLHGANEASVHTTSLSKHDQILSGCSMLI